MRRPGSSPASYRRDRVARGTSADWPRPYVILGINVVAADTDDEARFLASSGRQAFASLRQGMPIQLPPPSREFEKEVATYGEIPLREVTSIAMVGSPATVRQGITNFVAETAPDELMVVSHIYDHGARLRSYELVAELGIAAPHAP